MAAAGIRKVWATLVGENHWRTAIGFPYPVLFVFYDQTVVGSLAADPLLSTPRQCPPDWPCLTSWRSGNEACDFANRGLEVERL